jgi:hypothetical protein
MPQNGTFALRIGVQLSLKTEIIRLYNVVKERRGREDNNRKIGKGQGRRKEEDYGGVKKEKMGIVRKRRQKMGKS